MIGNVYAFDPRTRHEKQDLLDCARDLERVLGVATMPAASGEERWVAADTASPQFGDVAPADERGDPDLFMSQGSCALWRGSATRGCLAVEKDKEEDWLVGGQARRTRTGLLRLSDLS